MADWDLSRPDWEERLLAGQSLMPDNLPIDQRAAARALGIFGKLRLPDVPGTPRLRDAAGQWILDIVAALFGSIDPVTKWRLIRGLFLMVPKKNAKTTYAAAIMLTALLLNRRPLAEFILTGPSHEITGKSYEQASGMIALDDDGFLQKRLKTTASAQEIEDLKTGAVLGIKTFSTKIVTGKVVVGALVEEIHELGDIANAAHVIGQIRGGMVGTPEAFFAMITTQAQKPPRGVFKAELAVARAIRDGRSKVDTLPILYEFPREKQKDRAYWEHPANWPVVLPNLGKSIGLHRLVKDLEEAREKGDEEVQRWVSQHLNIEIGLGLHTDRWVGADYWPDAVDASITFEALLKRCEVIDVGIDGGGLDDLLGLAIVGRCRKTGRVLVWCAAWAHKGVLKRRKSEAPKLTELSALGQLVFVDKMSDADDQVAALVARIWKAGLLDKVLLDPKGVAGIVAALEKAKIPADLNEGVPQGWQLSGAIKDTERMLNDGDLRHADQELMTWCVGNAKAVAKGNAITIDKQMAGTAKIDPLVALFIAISRVRLNPKPRSNLAQLIAEDRAIL